MKKLNMPLCALVASLGFVSVGHAQDLDLPQDLPVQTETMIPTEDEPPLPPGAMQTLVEDFGALHMTDKSILPDHSFRSVWVRMFPLPSVPGGDPYPVTHDMHNLYLHSDNGLEIYCVRTQQLLGTEKDVHFAFNQKTYLLGKTKETLEPVWILPKGPSPIQMIWDKGKREVGVRVRGGVMIEQTAFDTATRWSAVNVLDVEQYLQSVVASEAIASWHPTALQVQAVAARTYGLRQVVKARATNRNWDLDPTTAFQSYRGSSFLKGGWHDIEQASTNAAVSSTAGQTVVYNGEIIQAYFSSNSGGTTCTANECFNIADLPYLKSVADAPGIQSAPLGTWGANANLSTTAIRRKLTSMGIKTKTAVKSISALDTGPSGRVWRLRVQLASGEVDLSEDQTNKLMQLFGGIRSHLYTLTGADHGKQHVVGHGYGHGVGMSQYGAQLFALSGWSTNQILLYYYPGTQIKNLMGGVINP